MTEYLRDLYNFWTSISLESFVHMFWPFVFFEFPRYVLLDFIGIVIYKLDHRFRRDKREAARRRLQKERPLISIIAPGKNEGKNLYKMVLSLREQTYNHIEIIVVDDGSNDDSGIILRNLERRGLIHKFIRNEQRGGKASAANTAYRFSRGDYIVHVDCDSSFDRDAIENIILPFYLDENCGAVGGNVKVRNTGASTCANLQTIEYMKNISIGRIATSYLGIYRIVSGAFGAFRRDVLDQIGGWDIGPGLDGDITVKIRKMGFNIKFAPDAVCLTAVPTVFYNLARQRLRWSRSLIRFRLRKHVDTFKPHRGFSLRNMLSFLENITFNLILDIKWWFYIFYTVLVFPSLFMYIMPINYLLYFIANSFEFGMAMWVSERRKTEWPLFLFLPLMVIYVGIFLRIVRTISYFQEFFFKSSYKDVWNPPKTSKKALERGL